MREIRIILIILLVVWNFAQAGEKGSKFSIKAGTGDEFVISVMPAEYPWTSLQPSPNTVTAETVLDNGAQIIITIHSPNTTLTKNWSGWFVNQ